MSLPTVRVAAVFAAASLAVGLAIVAPAGVAFAQQQAPQHPAAAGTVHPGGAPGTAKEDHSAKEDHPKMEAALKDLDKAKSELGSAAHDFHGHRAKAMELITQASEEIHQGLASD